MLSITLRGILSIHLNCRIRIFAALCIAIICIEVETCSPGRTGARRRSARKLTPLVFKQHVPNVPEHSLGASGPLEGRIWRDDVRFKNLVPNYNSDIVFKDEEGTGVDRLMSRRCQEKLDILAISVMNMWPGIRLRVTEGFDEDGHHPKSSLHYEGRAVAISTSDRDTSKYGMLARLAVDAGFDWVFYEARTHIYCSVKTESTVSGRFSGCFHGTSEIMTKTASKPLHLLNIGEEIVSGVDNHSLKYSKVLGFLHKDPFYQTNFIQIRTSSKNRLFVTREHLVFRNGQEAVHAADIVPGDLVTIISDNGTLEMSTVISIGNVSSQGVYAPLTEDGTIVVDGVLSSCYAVVRSHDLAHFVFAPLRLIYTLKDSITEIMVSIYSFVLKCIWTCTDNETVKQQDNEEVSYIHWYANLLCELSGIFVTICK